MVASATIANEQHISWSKDLYTIEMPGAEAGTELGAVRWPISGLPRHPSYTPSTPAQFRVSGLPRDRNPVRRFFRSGHCRYVLTSAAPLQGRQFTVDAW
jgi:hypothetical protein